MSVPVSTVSVLAFGFALGLRHAVEADHLAAVSTIASQRRGLVSASLIGGLWGVGHTLSLLLSGLVVIFLHVQIPERAFNAFEGVVAAMLVFLGVNALLRLRSGSKIHMHAHTHGPVRHIHPHVHHHSHEEGAHPHAAGHGPHHHELRLSSRPLIVGLIHGLAGSGALMLLVLSTISGAFAGLLYILLFGLGSTAGMMLVSALFSLPARLTAGRFARAQTAIYGVAGLWSVGLGLFMMAGMLFPAS